MESQLQFISCSAFDDASVIERSERIEEVERTFAGRIFMSRL